MAISWLVGKRNHDVNFLIATRKHDKAIELLREQLKGEPSNVYLRQMLADTLAHTGKRDESVAILRRLANDFAEAGFEAKAIAIAKKIERISPGAAKAYQDIAAMIPQPAALLRARSQDAADTNWPQPVETAIPAGPSARQAADFGSTQAHLADSASLGTADAEMAISDADLEVVIEDSGASEMAESWAVKPKAMSSPLFHGLREEELVPLMTGFRLCTYEPGDVIVAEGERSLTLFILTHGRVKAFVRNDVGGYTKVREMGDGDVFGEISLLTEQPRTATVTAASRCELLALDRETAATLCERLPGVGNRLMTFAQQRLNSPEEVAARRVVDDPQS